MRENDAELHIIVALLVNPEHLTHIIFPKVRKKERGREGGNIEGRKGGREGERKIERKDA